jgi:hypothetical protein
MSEVAQPLKITDEQQHVLSEEAQRMQTLYLDARNNAQNIFNFYLTFVTAVLGGLVFVVQASNNAITLQTRLILIALLFFSVLVGSVYLSAISGRYAQTVRFAHALDIIRRIQLESAKPILPSLYFNFLKDIPVAPKRDVWYLWLVPTGTFEMFMAFVNGASLALGICLMLGLGAVSPTTILLTALFVFLLTVTIYNAYSRLLIRRFTKTLDVRIYMGNQLQAWAARE